MIEKVPHFLALGPQIGLRGFDRRRYARNPVRYHHARVLNRLDLARIIRKQPHGTNPEVAQNRSWQQITPQIALETELLVRLHRIRSAVLQLVRPQLVHQSDAAPFLQFINNHAAAFRSDAPQSNFELAPAVAAQAVEGVPREALRVNAQQWSGHAGGFRGGIPHHQDCRLLHRFRTVRLRKMPLESVDAKKPILAREIGLRDLHYLKTKWGVHEKAG